MLVALVAVVVVLLTVYYFCRSPSNLPPGPTGVPILGYLPFLVKQYPPRAMDNLCKKYGPVLSLYMGSTLAVVLGDYKTIRKALADMGDVFSNRPKGLVEQIGDMFNNGILFSNGRLWTEHRKLATSTLGTFCDKLGLENVVLSEIECFIEAVSQKSGNPFDITDQLFMSISNATCIFEFGKRFEYNDPKFLQLLHSVRALASETGTTRPDIFFPWIRNIPGMTKLIGIDSLRRAGMNLYLEIMKLSDEQKKTYIAGSKSDYIEAFLTERDSKRTQEDKELFNDVTLNLDLFWFFIAGAETSSTTLKWALLYMMLHPDIQRQVQKEIDDVIGRERMPSSDDRLRMPYTDATLMEVQRISTILPLSAPHCTAKDVTFQGYHIPEGTMIFPNLWAVHHDPSLFPDPDSFRPERFINQDGKAARPEYLVNFSTGKRYCVGEPLARMELFLYFTTMLQKFTFVKPEGAVLTTEAEGEAIERPVMFEVCAIKRVD